MLAHDGQDVEALVRRHERLHDVDELPLLGTVFVAEPEPARDRKTVPLRHVDAEAGGSAADPDGGAVRDGQAADTSEAPRLNALAGESHVLLVGEDGRDDELHGRALDVGPRLFSRGLERREAGHEGVELPIRVERVLRGRETASLSDEPGGAREDGTHVVCRRP